MTVFYRMQKAHGNKITRVYLYCIYRSLLASILDQEQMDRPGRDKKYKKQQGHDDEN